MPDPCRDAPINSAQSSDTVAALRHVANLLPGYSGYQWFGTELAYISSLNFLYGSSVRHVQKRDIVMTLI